MLCAKRMKRFALSSMFLMIAVFGIEEQDIVKAEDNPSDSKQEEVFYQNPIYDDVTDEQTLKQELLQLHENGVALYSDEVYDSVDEAGDYMREQMVNRCNNISVSFVNRENYDSGSIPKKLFCDAIEYSESSNGQEADALRFVYEGWSCSYYYRAGVWTVEYTVKYYTTYEQEQELTTAVNQALNTLNLVGETPAGKVKKIHDYICNEVAYDYDNLDNSDYQLQYTAYAALINKKSVCQGYAVLFYRMCREAGLSTRIITGATSRGAHAWNIVKIGNTYYNLDTTWDDQVTYISYDYYLKSNTDFSDHYAESEYKTLEFTSKFPISQTSYNETEKQLTISAKASRDQLQVGDTMLLSAVADGGSGNYTYSYLVHNKDNDSWYRLTPTFIDGNSFTWKATTAGNREFFVEVKDSLGKVVRSDAVNVCTADALRISGTASRNQIMVGDEIVLSGIVSGGSKDYIYSYLVHNKDNDSWYRFTPSFINSNHYTWKATTAGNRDFFIEAKDASGKIVRSTAISVCTTDKFKISAKANRVQLTVGDTVEISGSAIGGSKDYTYSYLVHNKDNNSWYRFTPQFIESNTYKWTAGSIGNREFFVEVKDATGQVVRSNAVNVVVK